MGEVVRLFISGLVPGVTGPELQARFEPFGRVSSYEMAPSKFYGSEEFHRGFAFVDLAPKDPAALTNCLAVYNGCKWRGGVLRCAPARPTFQHRRAEMQADVYQEAEIPVPVSGDEEEAEPVAPAMLHLKGDTFGVVIPVPEAGNGSRLELAAAEDSSPPCAAMAWDPLPVPPRAQYTFEAHLERVARLAPTPVSPPKQETEEEARESALAAWLQARDAPKKAQPKQRPVPKKQRRAEEAGILAGEAGVAAHTPVEPLATAGPSRPAAMARFAGSSDDEGEEVPELEDPYASDSSGASELAEFLAGEEHDAAYQGPELLERRHDATKRQRGAAAARTAGHHVTAPSSLAAPIPVAKKAVAAPRASSAAAVLASMESAWAASGSARDSSGIPGSAQVRPLLKSRRPMQPLPGVVSFMDDAVDYGGAPDLSRFGSGSSDEDEGLSPRFIPQVDGAAPADLFQTSASSESQGHTSSSSSSGDSGSDGADSGGAASEDAGEHAATAPSSEGSSEDEAGQSASSSSSSSSSEEEAGVSTAAVRKEAEGRPVGAEEEEEDSPSAAQRSVQGEVPSWAAVAFPAGAAFFRSEPLASVEATWRVHHEAWAQDYKSKNRQALRAQGTVHRQKRKRG